MVGRGQVGRVVDGDRVLAEAPRRLDRHHHVAEIERPRTRTTPRRPPTDDRARCGAPVLLDGPARPVGETTNHSR